MRSALRLLLALWLLPALAGGASLRAGSQDGKPPTLEQYWQQVEETRQAVADLEHQSDAMAASRLGQLADGWEAITQVSMPDGQLVPLDHSELAAALRRQPADLPALLGRLDSLLALHKRYPSGLFTLDDLNSLKAILANPRFQWGESAPSPLQDWIDRLLQRLNDWLNRLFGSLGSGGLGLSAAPFLTWGLVIVLVLILAYAGRGLLAGLVRDAELGKNGAGDYEPLSSDDALKRAEALSQGGDYRSAVRYLYLSALLLLDERGLLRYDRSRTNREYLRTVGGSPALLAPLRAVIEIFDRVWYGFEPIDALTYREYVAQVDELRKQRP